MANRRKAHRLTAKMSIYIKFLHQHGKQSIRYLWRKYGVVNNISLATIHRHAAGDLNVVNGVQKKGSGGRQKLLNDRHIRHLLRVFYQARCNNPNFSSKKVQLDAGLNNIVSNRTVRRALNANKLYYLQPRKKGLLTLKDLKNRLNFALHIKRNNNNTLDYWTKEIGFFFDGTGFIHKTHPQDQASAPKGRIWRGKGEGLQRGCTAKGSKAGYNGRVANFFVAISYNKGVISCEQYVEKLTGNMFSKFIEDHFGDMFTECHNPESVMFLQDGDPRQNSKVAKDTLARYGFRCHSIPARSPDLNAIENLFHLIDTALREEAIEKEIEHETFEQFSMRVRNCLLNYPKDVIDRVIESMPKRINMIIKHKGRRLKY